MSTRTLPAALSTSRDTPSRGETGPPLVVLASISAALFVAGIAVTAALAGAPLPSPFVGSGTALAYVREHPGAIRAGAFLHFGSAVPLAIYAATASARLRNLGIRNPGSLIALAGGVLSAAFLSLSALLSWTMVRPDVITDPALVAALKDLSFLAGGPGTVVPFGLLLAGIAVPGLLGALLPRGFAAAGLALALVAELSALTLLVDGAAYLLPVARFGGLAWLIAAGVLLPKRRGRAGA